MTNVKYTLYAEQGKTFKSGVHYLHIGSWLQLDLSRYVVLVHGTMSRAEYNGMCSKYLLSLYEYAPISWIDIFPYQDSGFFTFQKVGKLYKIHGVDEWRGELNHGFWY